MIITVTLNPAIDKTAKLKAIEINGLNRLLTETTDIGGKGINVSKTLKALHQMCKTHALVAGANGQVVADYLRQEKFTTAIYEADGSTRVNLKIVEDNGNLTEFNEVGPTVNQKQKELFLIKFLKLVHEGDIVVLSGSVAKGFNDNVYEVLCTECKKKGAKVILDADGPYFSAAIQASPDVIKPNRYELMKYYDVDNVNSSDDIIRLANNFIELGIKLVVVSLGIEGALFVSKDSVYKGDALKVDIKSTVGAGDAMVAAIAIALANDYSEEDMIKLAMATSSGACTTAGTKPADYDLVQSLIPQVKITKLK